MCVGGLCPGLSHTEREPLVGAGGSGVTRPLPCLPAPPALGTWQTLGTGHLCFHSWAGSHRPQHAHAENSVSGVWEAPSPRAQPREEAGLVADLGRGGRRSSALVRAAMGSRCKTPPPALGAMLLPRGHWLDCGLSQSPAASPVTQFSSDVGQWPLSDLGCDLLPPPRFMTLGGHFAASVFLGVRRPGPVGLPAVPLHIGLA